MNSYKVVIVVLILITLSACNINKSELDDTLISPQVDVTTQDIEKTNSENIGLEFYALRINDVGNEVEWVIDEQPLFKVNDVLEYEWDTHTIIFTDVFLESMNVDDIEKDPVMQGIPILNLFYPDQFVILLDGEELYRGYVEPQLFISFMPSGPTVVEVAKGIRIDCIDETLGIRDNDKLKEYVEDFGILK